MSIGLPGCLLWVLGLLDLEWPEIDEDEFEAAATGYRRMADLADEAAADARAGARIVAKANNGRSIKAFVSYWNCGSAASTDRLTEIFRVTAFAQYAMADHVTDVKSGVIWELEGLLDEFGRAVAAAAHSGAVLSESAMKNRSSVERTREAIKNRLSDLEERLTSEISRLRDVWNSGGSGAAWPRLTADCSDNVLAFDPLAYEQGARRIVQAADNMALAGVRYTSISGRTSSQLRQWLPALQYHLVK